MDLEDLDVAIPQLEVRETLKEGEKMEMVSDQAVEPKKTKEHRSKKRLKVAAEVEAASEEPPLPNDPEAMVVDKGDGYGGPELPAFPLPVAPDPPSRAQLAAQGADPAYADATVIDPSVTQPIDTVDISDKIKRRLKDLGIESLFAGKFVPRALDLNLLSDTSADVSTPVPAGQRVSIFVYSI